MEILLTSSIKEAIIEAFILARLQPKAADALEGLVCPIQHSPLFENETNKRFVEAYKKKYNRTPDNAKSTAYCAALVILSALEATGGDTTPQKLMDAMLATSYFESKVYTCLLKSVWHRKDGCPCLKYA